MSQRMMKQMDRNSQVIENRLVFSATGASHGCGELLRVRRVLAQFGVVFGCLVLLLGGLPTTFGQFGEAAGSVEQDEDIFGNSGDDEIDNLFGDPPDEGFFDGFGGAEGAGEGELPAETELVFPATAGADGLVALELKGVQVKDLVMQLAEWSGKPVWLDSLVADRAITLVTGRLLRKSEAFDLLGIALFEQGVALVDRTSYLAIIPISNISQGDAPIYGPGDDILGRTDRGMIAVKIYQMQHGRASNIVESFRRDGELISTQYAKIGYDDSSNQIMVMYNIGTLQRIQRIIDVLDVEGVPLVIEDFFLEHRDAEAVAQKIVELFSANDGQSGGGQGLFGGRNTSRSSSSRRSSSGGGGSGVATTMDLRVTFDKQTNSITVRAEETVMLQIRERMKAQWDLPNKNLVPTAVYELLNSDVIRVRDMLRNMFSPPEEASGTIDANFFGGSGRSGFSQRNRGSSSSSSADGIMGLHSYAGDYSFEADENKNRLFVTARSAEAMRYISDLITQIDEAGSSNTPMLIELKYANAERVAEQLNAIFAATGQGIGFDGMEEGLSVGDDASPFGSSGGGGGGDNAPEAQEISFWWQGGRVNEDERPISDLIGQMRIVPIARQNALLILGRPENRAAIKTTIDQLDQPGRQVLILATVAAVSDETIVKLGLRWGSDRSVINSSSPDNQLNVVGDLGGTVDNVFTKLFDTSVLNLGLDLTAVLSLLQRDTDTQILSSPRVFTSDNREAVFFDGQDIPFISDSSFTDTGQQNQSFDYRAVGIRLAVRPHITVEGNVDMHVNLELSSIVQGQTLFGGFIVDRRETNSRVTVRNGQTIVISGILRSEESEIIRKVPFLGDIPIIGQIFFRNKDKTIKQTELVAFITPIILENPDHSDQMFRGEMQKFQNRFPEEAEEILERLGPGEVSGSEGVRGIDDSDH